MQGSRELGNALVVALVSIGLILGALSISLVEFAPEAGPTATGYLIPSPIPPAVTETLPPASTSTFSLESIPSLAPTFTPTNTPPTNCLAPPGWGQITITAGDTLESIAARYRIPADELRRANCLFSNSLVPGSRLYVPPVTPNTSIACIPGAAGWVNNYTVNPGENLYRIGVDHYTTLELMRKVNCRTSDTIYPGEVLWVPNVPATRTPVPSSSPGSTVTSYPTDPLTETALPFTVTFVPTNTIPPTFTPSPTTFP